MVVEADTVILAIGQSVDVESLSAVEITPRGTIATDPDTMEASLPGVYSGGDAAFGPRTLIVAIAEGRIAAASIHKQFTGEVAEEQPGQMVQLQQFHRLDDVYDRYDRLEVPSLPSERRIGLQEVELGFTPEQARCEAKRCLRCFANILLDVDTCVLCALCSDVCPLDLISLVPAGEVGGGEAGTALMLDETACIRCGLCIDRCPTDALSMGVWSGVGVPAPEVLHRDSAAGRSIFRSPDRVTERDRAAGHWSNFILHIYPVKVRRKEITFRYTWFLGVISLTLFASLLISGIFLMFFYVPSPDTAYGNIQTLQTEVAFGQFLRNVHRWSAHLMVVAVAAHMARVFYRGAYKSPREFNWVIGVVLLVLTLLLSFTGYLLPWDQLAYWAVTVGTAMGGFVPVIGGTVEQILLGGPEVGAATLLRFYVLHVAVLPSILVIGIAVHLWRWRKDAMLDQGGDDD